MLLAMMLYIPRVEAASEGIMRREEWYEQLKKTILMFTSGREMAAPGRARLPNTSGLRRMEGAIARRACHLRSQASRSR
jgi:hypothetical protein